MIYGIDASYIILVMPAILFTLWANYSVKSTYNKYERVYSRRNISGAQAAQRLLDINGIRDVNIERIPGELTDHFDPVGRVVRLSDGVYSGTSAAAIGVACHEIGHVLQHETGYAPIRIRNAIIPITNIGSTLSMPLIFLGVGLSYATEWYFYVIYLGIAMFAMSTIFQLVTLPTEFNASRRALKSIRETNMLDDDEIAGAKKVLGAAAMTYVAALAVSLMQLIRFLLIFGRRKD